MKLINKVSIPTVVACLVAVWALNKYDDDILGGKTSFFG